MVPAAGRRRFMRLRASTRVRPVSTRRPWEPNERCGALVSQASRLRDVRYDIRGPVLRRARQLEADGHQILKLNLGNPAPFGLHPTDDVLGGVVSSIGDAQGSATPAASTRPGWRWRSPTRPRGWPGSARTTCSW